MDNGLLCGTTATTANAPRQWMNSGEHQLEPKYDYDYDYDEYDGNEYDEYDCESDYESDDSEYD